MGADDHTSLSTADLIQLALAAPDEDSEWPYVTLLQERGTAGVFEAARLLCGSGEPRERALGVDILAQGRVEWKTLRRRSVPLLLKMLGRETDVDVVWSLCFALGHLHDTRAIAPLVRWAQHPDADIRYGVVYGLLGYEDDRALTALIVLSADVEDKVRDWATFGLGTQIEADTPALRDALVARLTDPHADTRAEAGAGLARRQDERVVASVRQELAHDEVGSLIVEAARDLADPRLHAALVALEACWDVDSALLSAAISACASG